MIPILGWRNNTAVRFFALNLAGKNLLLHLWLPEPTGLLGVASEGEQMNLA